MDPYTKATILLMLILIVMPIVVRYVFYKGFDKAEDAIHNSIAKKKNAENSWKEPESLADTHHLKGKQ